MSAAAGAVMLGFAGWMTYRPGDDGGAVTALVVAGAIVALVALIGRMPSRIKAGDTEIELLEEQVGLMASVMNTDQLETSVYQLAEAATGSEAPSHGTSIVGQHLLFEETTENILSCALSTLGDEWNIDTSASNPGFKSDALITSTTTHDRVAIEIKLAASPTSIMRLLKATQHHSIHVIVLTREIPEAILRNPRMFAALIGTRRCFISEPEVDLVVWQLKTLAGSAAPEIPPPGGFVELKR